VQFINSFRVRLLLVLAALLIAMLGVQYYLNVLAERNNARVVAEQEQALAAGVEIGVKSISTPDRLIELRDNANQPLLNEGAGRVTNILTVDSEWQIQDSLDPAYLPKENADGTYQYFHLRDATTLPPLVNAGQLVVDPAQLPPSARNAAQTRAGAPRAFPFPVDTVRGRWYVFVALGRAKATVGMWNRQAARPLLYTLAVLLVAISFAALLVWRFTRPIEELSAAARRVAAGDFDFHVPAAERSDEMGQLARVFNEMINRLARTRELEAQLHQAEQSAVVGRLASAIAHEIRNPLNYINLTLDHLRSSLAPEDPKKRETFERLASQLKTEVGRINRHISDFLNYSRPARLELRPLDLRAEIEDALRLVEVQASESNIKMELKSAGEIPPALGDAESLRSVFTNLFLNAVQAINGDGGGQLTITLAAEEANQRARVDITDTGPGIPPEHISKVFEPYFSTKETGTGLGLAIVKKAIDDHGGTITVISKQGTGTTFTITLPTERKDEG
jgi:signal transduction histidine kinase